MSDADILLITYNRPAYVALSLPRLLSTCPKGSRVWVWHNGTDAAVLAEIERHSNHPRFHRFHHSERNVGLRPAINWLWTNAAGKYVSKVDDDSLMEPGWVEWLCDALDRTTNSGVFGTWRFEDSDFDSDLSANKVQELSGVRLLRNHWVQGSGHMIRRELVSRLGPLQDGQSFTEWCLAAAKVGYINGWPMPFKHEEHLDDPRHPLTMFTDDAAFLRHRPLSAVATGVDSIEAWTRQVARSAYDVQAAPLDLHYYFGWRRKLSNATKRLRQVAKRSGYGQTRDAGKR